MKISLGFPIQKGPWGGGNQFARSLAEFLTGQGCEVFFDLRQRDLDLILLCDPRSHRSRGCYTDRAICRYLLFKNWRTIVAHRINECDERKGTSDVNRQLMRANACADHTVYISHYLKNLFADQGWASPHATVIYNGADRNIFHPNNQTPWDNTGPLKLVTHHWSCHAMKGFDIYERLDHMLSDTAYRGNISFTYIGNIPPGFRFQNARYVEPLSGPALATELSKHHVYLTASQNEPAGMHHIEGAMCGLPLLYRESGALPEYCRDYGIGFTKETFVERLHEMMDGYPLYQKKMTEYPHLAEKMVVSYHELFCQLLAQRNEILRQRRRSLIWRGLLGGLGLSEKTRTHASLRSVHADHTTRREC